MSSYQTIETPQDYVNYTFNITSRGITEVSGEITGLSNTVTTILGQLAFKTSEYLTHTESLVVGLGAASVAGFASATREAIKFEQAIANVQAIGGESINAMKIGQEAMKYSGQFGMDVNSMTEGLEALSRAGLTATDVMSGVLAEGVKLSKLEGMDLEDSINNLIATTNLLSTDELDVNSQEYADAVKAMNQHIVSTSESAPINAENIIQTLQHVGGYASANNIDQEDLFAVIAQLGAKGTKGEMAGTALRAFVAAGQKDQAQRALARIGLNVSDLWDESGEAMLPISEMKEVLDSALEARGYSKQEKLEFYADFAGYKQANQIMKIDTSEVKEYKETIAQAWDLGKKLETILGTTHNNIQTLYQTTKNFLTKVGKTALPIINAIVIPLKWGVKLLDAMPFSENIVGILAATFGIKALLLLINRVVPTLASMYTNFAGAEKKAKGIRGHIHDMVKDLKDAKDILTHINDPTYLSNIRIQQGLMGEQSYKMHKEVTKEVYRDLKVINPELPDWDDLENFNQEAIFDLMESYKKTEAYQTKQTVKTNKIKGINATLQELLLGRKPSEKQGVDLKPSNTEKSTQSRLNNDNEVHKDLGVVKNYMQEVKALIDKNAKNKEQKDIGFGIMSVAHKLADVFVAAFNRDKNQSIINIDDIKIKTDRENKSQVSQEIHRLHNESQNKDLPDIGFAYNYDLTKLNNARNALIKDINSVASAFSNTDLEYINSTQRKRIGKQLNINEMSSRGKYESSLRNEAEIRDIFRKFEEYEDAVRHGLVPSIASDSKNLAFNTATSTFWVDPKDENKGIRIEQIEAFEDVLDIKNASGNRAERIQRILQEYEGLSSNERYIALENGIYEAKQSYSDFLNNRETPSAILTSHISNDVAKELLEHYSINTDLLTGTPAEQLQQAFHSLEIGQQEEIKEVLYANQKRHAQGIYTESELAQLSMMFDKLAMLNNAINKYTIFDEDYVGDIQKMGLYNDYLENPNKYIYGKISTSMDDDFFDNFTNVLTFSPDYQEQKEKEIAEKAKQLNYIEPHKRKSECCFKLLETLEIVSDNVKKIAERIAPSTNALTIQEQNINDEKIQKPEMNIVVQGDIHVNSDGNIIPEGDVVIDPSSIIEVPQLKGDTGFFNEENLLKLFYPITALRDDIENEAVQLKKVIQALILYRKGLEIIAFDNVYDDNFPYMPSNLMPRGYPQSLKELMSQNMLNRSTRNIKKFTDENNLYHPFVSLEDKIENAQQQISQYSSYYDAETIEKQQEQPVIIGSYRVPMNDNYPNIPPNLMPRNYSQTLKNQIRDNALNRIAKTDTDIQAQRYTRAKAQSDGQNMINDLLLMRNNIYSNLAKKHILTPNSLTDDELDFIGLNKQRDKRRNREYSVELLNSIYGPLDNPPKVHTPLMHAQTKIDQYKSKYIQAKREEWLKEAQERNDSFNPITTLILSKKRSQYSQPIGPIEPLSQDDYTKAHINALFKDSQYTLEFSKIAPELIDFVDKNFITQNSGYIPVGFSGDLTSLEQAKILKENQDYITGVAIEEITKFYQEQKRLREEEYNRGLEIQNKENQAREEEHKRIIANQEAQTQSAKREAQIQKEKEQNVLKEQILITELKRKFETGLYQLTDEELVSIDKAEYSTNANSKARADALREKRRQERNQEIIQQGQQYAAQLSTLYDAEAPNIGDYQEKVKEEQRQRREKEKNKQIAQQQISRYSSGYYAETITDDEYDKWYAQREYYRNSDTERHKLDADDFWITISQLEKEYASYGVEKPSTALVIYQGELEPYSIEKENKHTTTTIRGGIFYGGTEEDVNAFNEDWDKNTKDTYRRQIFWTQQAQKMKDKFHDAGKSVDDFLDRKLNKFSDDPAKLGALSKNIKVFTYDLESLQDAMTKAGKIFPPFLAISVAMEGIIGVLSVVTTGLATAETVLTAARMINTEVTKEEAKAEGKEAAWHMAQRIKRYTKGHKNIETVIEKGSKRIAQMGNAAIKGVDAVLGFIIENIAILGPIAAAIAIAVGALWLSEQNHAKALKEATKAQEEAMAATKASYMKYESLHKARKNENDAIKRQQLARKESIALYKLEADRLKQLNAIKKETDLRNDYMWGEYGKRAQYQKMGPLETLLGGPITWLAKWMAGDFESQYQNYEGSTGEIRRIKEDSLGNMFATSNQKAVSAWYDAHIQQLGQIEAFAPELQELYDLESKLIDRYGSLEDARASQEFQDAVQDFADATGINRKTAEKYLDYLQMEKNVENARYAMQAEVSMITAEAQANAYKALYGDASGLGDMEGVEDAMVYATADQIFKDAYHELWWSMLMEWLQAIYNVLTLHLGEASKHAKAAGAYQDGMRELAENQQRITEEGVEIAREDQRGEYKDEQYSSYGDTLFGGAISSAAAQEQDYIAEELSNTDKTYNASKANGKAAVAGFKDGLNQHSPGDMAMAMAAELDYMQHFVTIFPFKIFSKLAQKQNSEYQNNLDVEAFDMIQDDTKAYTTNRRRNSIEPIQKDILFTQRQTYNKINEINKNINDVNKWYASGHNNGDNSYSARTKNALWYDKGFGLPPGVDPNDPAVQEELQRRRQETTIRAGSHGIAGMLQYLTGPNGRPIGAKGAAKKGVQLLGHILNPEEVPLPFKSVFDKIFGKNGDDMIDVAGHVVDDGVEAGAKSVDNVMQLGAKETDDIIKLGTKGVSNGGKIAGRRTIKIAGENTGEQAIKVLSKKGAQKTGQLTTKEVTEGLVKSGAKTEGKVAGKTIGEVGTKGAAKGAAKGGAKAGSKGMAKTAGKALGKAAPFIGPLVTAGFSIAEHNPFEKHYNEDGSEKRALQSTGEVAGEVGGSVAAMALGGLAAGAVTAGTLGIGAPLAPLVGAVVEMGASLILEPLGKAVGGLIGWAGDEVLNGAINLGSDIIGGAMNFLFPEDAEQNPPTTAQISNEIDSGTFDNFQNSLSSPSFDNFSSNRQQSSENISVNNGKTEIHIHTININTEDDPEKIKTALMELIIEFGDLVTPKQVSRIIGTPPATSVSSTEDITTENENTENTENTENSNTNTNNTPTT